MEWKYKKLKYEEGQGGMRRRMAGKRSRPVATTVGVVHLVVVVVVVVLAVIFG